MYELEAQEIGDGVELVVLDEDVDRLRLQNEVDKRLEALEEPGVERIVEREHVVALALVRNKEDRIEAAPVILSPEGLLEDLEARLEG